MPTKLNYSYSKFQVWKIMEFAGILPNKKRRVLINILEDKFQNNELEPDERKILSATKIYPENKRMRRKYLKQELKAWEKRAAI
jgi:hypothetical protein